jgi:hypothetical protein
MSTIRRPTEVVPRNLAAQHRRSKGRRRETGHTAGDDDPEVALDSFGEVTVEQAQDDA